MKRQTPRTRSSRTDPKPRRLRDVKRFGVHNAGMILRVQVIWEERERENRIS